MLYACSFSYGDADQWLDRSHQVFTDTFSVTRINHFHLEPYVNVARWVGDRLEMWSCNQDPFVIRADLARIFGPAENLLDCRQLLGRDHTLGRTVLADEDDLGRGGRRLLLRHQC